MKPIADIPRSQVSQMVLRYQFEYFETAVSPIRNDPWEPAQSRRKRLTAIPLYGKQRFPELTVQTPGRIVHSALDA
jgi:hypothetical protein